MSARLSTKIQWAVVIILVAGSVWLAWDLVGLHVDEPARPVSPETAQRYVPVGLPPEAENIAVAAHRQWVQYGQYVRFESPVAVCLAYAEAVVPEGALVEVDQFQLDAAAMFRGRTFSMT